MADAATTPDGLVTRVIDVHRRLLHLAAALTDDGAGAPSALPGWSRAHVLTHLADNARGFARMTAYARAGQLVELYDGRQRGRDASIEAGSGRRVLAIYEDVPIVMRGRLCDLAAWMAGRSAPGPVRADDGDLQSLGPWP
ncbi:MAG: maleylpyruvate isomerase N-terminal domain-containing protein [Carbonactinosporaceae bacterium]